MTMKITINIDATPKEFREFLGLPDVQPFHAELLETLRDNMRKGVAGFDPVSLMKPLMPIPAQTVEALQKAMWDALAQSTAAMSGAEQQPGKGESRKKG